MSARTKKSAQEAPAADVSEETIPGIKGFDQDLTCQGYQFEFGHTYEHDGNVKVCCAGFHAITGHPLEVFKYYPPATSRYAEVIQSGKTDREEGGDSKIASARITIGAEIHLHELAQHAVKWVFDRAKWSEGPVATEPNEGATASGVRGAATASGYAGAATASGDAGRVRGKPGCALFLVHRNDHGEIMHAWAGIVGRDGIEPDVFYTLNAEGRPEVTE